MQRGAVASAVVALVVVSAGLAVAQMSSGQMGPGAGSGHMGPGMMGPGMMGAPCPGTMGGGTAAPQMTGEGAKQAAQQYADQHLKGFTVDKVLPMTGMHMTMYSVELDSPQGEVRVLHVNPWGAVMPFGGPWRRAG